MPFTPNAIPTYAQGPMPLLPAVLPATAKTVFTDITNAVKVVDTVATGRIGAVTGITVEATANLSAGKLVAYLWNGTTLVEVASVAHVALTSSATAAAQVVFDKVTATAPIYVPEGWSLYLATLVAQTTNSMHATGIGKLF